MLLLEHFDMLKTLYPVFVFPIIFIVGAIIGSFLNVCISRWQKNESVIKPRSRCQSCGASIVWYHNIPILSYILLRGCCDQCHAAIGWRHLVVEILTGLAFVFVTAWMPIDYALVAWFFLSLLIVGSVMDLESFTLADPVLVTGFIGGLLASYLVPGLHDAPTGLLSLKRAIQALCLATGGLFWFSILVEAWLKKPAMGLGDSLWLGIIALFTGITGAIFALFAGALLGSCFIGMAILLEKITGKALCPRVSGAALLENTDTLKSDATTPLKAGVAIPFGPFLSLAAAIYYIFLQKAVHAWLDWYHYLSPELFCNFL